MKTKTIIICAAVLAAFLAVSAVLPDVLKPQRKETKIPLGVSDAQASAAAETDADYPVHVKTGLSEAGVLAVDIDTLSTCRIKVKITKGNEALYYNMDDDRHLDIPLQLGDGGYTVMVFRNISDAEYEAVFSEEVAFTAENPRAVFLASNEIVNYDASRSVSGLTKEVVGDAATENEAVSRITGYVLGQFKYDEKKGETLAADYVPDIDRVLLEKGGVCYDFAAVTAAMLREAGIPAKLVMGYRSGSDIYHAWNEAFIGGEWVVLDTTWDSVMKHRKVSIQDPKIYRAEKIF